VCYLQPGHGAGTYNDANYRKLVIQAIKWVSEK
jgi:trehalose utilization protein